MVIDATTYKMTCFTCRRPRLDVSCTVDHYILGLPFLCWTQTTPEGKEETIKAKVIRIICTIFPTEYLKILKINNERKPVWSPVSISKEVQSVHGQWFHRTSATPAAK